MADGEEAALVAALRAAGIAEPARELRWLGAGRVDRAELAARVARRVARREPLALIVGTAPFLDFELGVSGATLVPRQDSELLVEVARAEADGLGVRRILDLGTGTGCLLLGALREFPAAFGVGVDLVEAACGLAAANAARLGLGRRAAFLCGDWASAIEGGFDLVFANPPYIKSAEIATLMPEVAWHEPRSALDGGVDGLEAYRALLAVLPRLLGPGGVGLFELGAGQAPSVAALARAAGLHGQTRREEAGRDEVAHERVLILRADAEAAKKSFGRPTECR